ncbi:MAG: hypothetical protein RLY70_4382 [Planctomycetota bacterium]|jgi:hypothetical protein
MGRKLNVAFASTLALAGRDRHHLRASGRGWNGVAMALSVAIVLATIGCGESGPVLYPVSGTVRFEGKPLPQVGVSFIADPSKGNDSGHIAAASADAEGRFTLSTVGETGAPPGWYKVVVSPYTPGPVEVPKPPYHVKYLTVDTTDLSIEVKAGAAADAYDLTLDN